MLLPFDYGTHITVNEKDDFEVMNGLPALTAAGEAIEAGTTTTTTATWTSTTEPNMETTNSLADATAATTASTVS